MSCGSTYLAALDLLGLLVTSVRPITGASVAQIWLLRSLALSSSLSSLDDAEELREELSEELRRQSSDESSLDDIEEWADRLILSADA